MGRRGKLFQAFVRALIFTAIFIGMGAGLRAVWERPLWRMRSATYVALAPTVATSTLPAAVPTGTTRVEQEVTESALVPQPTLTLSRDTLEQADTFAVTLADIPLGVTPQVTWRDRTYDLLKVGGQWLGFLGADAKQAPSFYTLEVNIGTSTLARQIAVLKRVFPVTVLAVTPELEERGYDLPAIQSNVATENARLNSALIYRPEAFFSKPFVNPLDRITVVGAYGNVRKSGPVELQHLGVDLDAAEGTPVYAVNDGVVNLAENLTNYGKTIVVDHGLGIFSYYLHLSEMGVEAGDHVARGSIIAKSGNTGYSIAPHLHFSVRIRNASVDPLRFIETANEALASN